MTVEEAKKVLGLIRSGAVQQDLDDARIALMMQHLAPLPHAPVLANVQRWIGAPRLDGRPKFVTTPDEMLEACGVPGGARADLTRAILDGGRLLPDLRAVSGWSHVGPNEALPQGVVELDLIHNGALAALEIAESRALPPPSTPTIDVRAKLRELAAQRSMSRALSSKFHVGISENLPFYDENDDEIDAESRRIRDEKCAEIARKEREKIAAYEREETAARAAEIERELQAAEAHFAAAVADPPKAETFGVGNLTFKRYVPAARP